jgi:hypothetical protein
MPALARPLLARTALLLAALAVSPAPSARAEAPAPIAIQSRAEPGSVEQALERERERQLRRFHLRLRHGLRQDGAPPADAGSRAARTAPRPWPWDESIANQRLAAPVP